MIKLKVLNIYKLSINQILIFMFNIKTNIAPFIFGNKFTEIQQQYLTRFSKSSCIKNQLVRSQTKFSVLSRGPMVLNKLLDQQHKYLNREACFKKAIKLFILSLENEKKFRRFIK